MDGNEQHRDALLQFSKETGVLPGLVIDGFENTSRKHIMGIVLAAGEHWWSYDARQFGPRHDAIALGQAFEDLVQEFAEKNIELGSFCADSDGGVARMRRILARRWERIIFSPCFAHLINCIVGAIFRHPLLMEMLKAATDFVTKAVNCTARWLPILLQEIKDMYGILLALLKMVKSRWNSAHQCVASLLRVRSALKMFVLRHQHERDFPDEFLCAASDQFWADTIAVECLLRPLCRASLLFQRQNLSYAEVTLVFLHLFQTFNRYSKFAAANCYVSMASVI